MRYIADAIDDLHSPGQPIVPVMMVPAATWKASGWLGIITAGTLWTQMTDDLKDSVDKLVLQIQRTLENRKLTSESDTDDGDTDHSSTDDDELEFSVDEMRAELERLMADLRNNRPGARGSAFIAGDLSNGMCVVPAGTPLLPSGLRVTVEMEGLLKALLATHGTDTTQVGFCGMGGIGKTVVSTWLVRHAAVRKQFKNIAWYVTGCDVGGAGILVFHILLPKQVNINRDTWQLACVRQ